MLLPKLKIINICIIRGVSKITSEAYINLFRGHAHSRSQLISNSSGCHLKTQLNSSLNSTFNSQQFITAAGSHYYSLSTDCIEKTASSNSSMTASCSYLLAHTENTTPLLLLYWPLPSNGHCMAACLAVIVQQQVHMS
jgi:hypothetical protein